MRGCLIVFLVVLMAPLALCAVSTGHGILVGVTVFGILVILLMMAVPPGQKQAGDKPNKDRDDSNA